MATPAAKAATLERLRRAVAEATARAGPPGAVRRPAPPLERELPPLERILGGAWHETESGRVFARDEWFPLGHQHGNGRLASVAHADAVVLGRLARAESPLRAERLAYFDIETTGLAGGSGTYIVVAGVGSFEMAGEGVPPAFRLRQYFLADIGAERAMLEMLAADLGRFDGLVTYNGRAFDVPCLEVRMTMARVASPVRELAHIDLLHGVRRLYRHRMPACRLPEAERRLLRLHRPDDIPGWLIPSLYFDYQRLGRVAPLRSVLRHNADDVLSMVGVLTVLAKLIGGEPEDAEDVAAVARWWEHEGDEERARRLYRAALPWLEGGDDWAWAAERYAALCKRAGEREEAARIWRSLWERGSRAAGLELAKDLEHRLRAPGEAAAIVASLVAEGGLAATEEAALRHRLARLQRKRAV